MLVDFCVRFGGPVANVPIFPGINYGHIEFKDVEGAERLMTNKEALDTPNCANIQFEGSDNKDRVVVFLYTPLESH